MRRRRPSTPSVQIPKRGGTYADFLKEKYPDLYRKMQEEKAKRIRGPQEPKPYRGGRGVPTHKGMFKAI